MQPKEIQDWATLLIALYGAVLATFNFLHERRKSKLKLHIVPQIAVTEAEKFRLAVQVRNLGQMPATIEQIGFSKSRFSRITYVFSPSLINGITLPERLEPGASLTLFATAGACNHAFTDKPRYAFIGTGNGKRYFARNAAFRSYVEKPSPTATDQEVIDSMAKNRGLVASANGFPKGRFLHSHDS